MEDFVIDRAKWLTGPVLEKIDSCLYDNETGLQCCLGQYLVANGVPLESLRHLGMPASLVHGFSETAIPQAAAWLIKEVEADGDETYPEDELETLRSYPADDSDLADQLQMANDNRLLSPADREAQLVELFRQAGVAVTFTGDADEALETVLAWVTSSRNEDYNND